MEFTNIYQSIVDASTVYSLPPPWNQIRPRGRFRDLPIDRAALFAQLCANFTEAELTQSGVVVLGQNNELALQPDLAQTQSPILVVRDTSSPRNILGLVVEMRPICEAGKRCEFLHRLVAQQISSEDFNLSIVLVHSMPEAAILTAIGIPTAPTTSLAGLAPAELRTILALQHFVPDQETFAKRFRRLQRCSMASSGLHLFEDHIDATATLVIPGFRLSDPGSSALMEKDSLQLMRNLQTQYRETTWSFDAWNLSDATRSRLAWQIRHDLPRHWPPTVRQSLETECVSLTKLTTPPKPAHQRLAEAVLQLQGLQQKSASPTERQKAWREFTVATEEARIAPLLAAAQKSKRPLQRELLLQLADLGRLVLPLLHNNSLQMARLLEDQYISGSDGIFDVKSLNTLKSLLSLVAPYHSLLKEAKACQPKKLRTNSFASGLNRSNFRFPKFPP